MENTTLEEQLDYDDSNKFSSQKIKRVTPEMFRKHKWQTEILNELFKDVNLKITCELRNKAVRLTGLKWTKIYKWIFDKRVALRSHKIKKQALKEIPPVFTIVKVNRALCIPNTS